MARLDGSSSEFRRNMAEAGQHLKPANVYYYVIVFVRASALDRLSHVNTARRHGIFD